MEQSLTTPALVTVYTLSPWLTVDMERFETPHVFRPVWTDPNTVYSVERHREGVSILALTRSMPVDLATWLHRCGAWDSLREDPSGS